MFLLRLFLAPALLLASLVHHAEMSAYVHMIDRVSASVVRITGEEDVTTIFGPVHATYSCSGFVIETGKVLTAAHCVGDKMLADGAPVKMLAADKLYDLALLSTDTIKPALPFRDAPVSRFEHLTAIGYAFGWDQLAVLSERVVIVNIRPATDTAPGIIVQPGYIGGQSGGPVVDDAGLVVGIVQQTNEGAGYGVGTLLIRAFLLGASA